MTQSVQFVNVDYCVSFQRFKGTEIEVTEEVKVVKVDDTPKEVKTEPVDEVPPMHCVPMFLLS